MLPEARRFWSEAVDLEELNNEVSATVNRNYGKNHGIGDPKNDALLARALNGANSVKRPLKRTLKRVKYIKLLEH